MGAVLSLVFLAWTAATWFSGPYDRPFLGISLFRVPPVIPFMVFILWSLAVFYRWVRCHWSREWENFKEYLQGQRTTVIILCVILVFHLVVISGPAILDYRGENDADSGLHGLAGYHIASGSERPMFVYGGHYVGSLKAHIAAFFNWVFGRSPIYQRAIGAFFFLGFLVGLFIFVRRLFNEKTALWATALAAVPPFAAAAQLRFDEFAELPLWGIIGFNLLLSLTHEKKENWKYFFWYGAVLGLQFFAHPQAIYFIITGILVILAADKLFFLRWRNWLIPLGFIIGTVPTWVDSYFHNWVIFRVFFGKEVSSVERPVDWFYYTLNHFNRNLTEFWGLGPIYPLPFKIPHIVIKIVIAAALAGFIYYVYLCRKELKVFISFKHTPVGRLIPLLMGVVVTGIYLMSAKSVLDGPFRYVFVLWMVIPVAIAAGATMPHFKIGKGAGIGFLVISLGLFSLSHYYYLEAVRESGQRWQEWLAFCRQKNITRFYGDFWLVYYTNFVTREEIIGSSSFPLNNNPYMKYREKVDYSNKPPAYVFSPGLSKASFNQAVEFKKKLYKLGIKFSFDKAGQHLVFYNLSEHLTPMQLSTLTINNNVAFTGISSQKMPGSEKVGGLYLVDVHCCNRGESTLRVDGKRAMAELVLTRADGTLLRRQPLENNVPPGDSFICPVLLSAVELKGQPVYIHVKLNDIIASANKQPFILQPADLDKAKPARHNGVPAMANIQNPLPGEQLPVFMLIDGWGKRPRPAHRLVQWSGGKHSDIAFIVTDPAKGMIIELQLEPYKDKIFKGQQQSLRFYCNGVEINGEYPLESRCTLRLSLSGSALHDGLNRLSILPRLVEPEYRRMRMDPGFNYRPRAFALHSCRFLPPAAREPF